MSKDQSKVEISETDKMVIEFIGRLIKRNYPDTHAFRQSLIDSIQTQMCVLRGTVDASEHEQLNKDLVTLANSSNTIDVIEKPKKQSLH